MSNAAKSFDILATSLSVLYNYYILICNKIIFRSVYAKTFRYLS